jgi:hypothetical protein
MAVHCCDMFETQLAHADKLVDYIPHFREYGLPTQDGDSHIAIRFCPWCGATLPPALRDKWYEMLREMGYDDPAFAGYPWEFRSDVWWKDRGL